MEGRRLLKNTAQREIEKFADIAIKTTNVAGVSYIQRSQNVAILFHTLYVKKPNIETFNHYQLV